jgi:hypothetical protein
MPIGLDEYPIHQAAASMQFPGTSDRGFYDRCYFNAHDRTGRVFMLTGLGVYPNLGVIDAYASVRVDDRQISIHLSDALGDDRMVQEVGPYRIDVVSPLDELRLTCDGDAQGVAFDLTWKGSFPAIQEPQHVMHRGNRVILDGCRFAQVGTWAGWLRADGERFDVTPDVWLGTRDRSWGIRPVGEPEPGGRWAAEIPQGIWWLYVPLRFEDYAVILIAQELPDGTRILNDARRVSASGVEQLGWPEVEIAYKPGTRFPSGAKVHFSRLADPLEIEPLGFVSLAHGPGYSGGAWGHGQWMGHKWVEGTVHDMATPEVTAMLPFSMIDHACRARLGGDVGYGLFEHANIGRHDPSGFKDYGDVAG